MSATPEKQAEWLMCPVCLRKTRLKIRPDTVIKNLPLYCPKCRQTILVDVANLAVSVQK